MHYGTREVRNREKRQESVNKVKTSKKRQIIKQFSKGNEPMVITLESTLMCHYDQGRQPLCYIQVSRHKIKRTVEVGHPSRVYVDLDSKGRLVGVEICILRVIENVLIE